jgi:hypothetical protein
MRQSTTYFADAQLMRQSTAFRLASIDPEVVAAGRLALTVPPTPWKLQAMQRAVAS